MIAAALVYSWVVAAFRPFTWPMNLAVALPVVVLLVAVIASWDRSRVRPAPDPVNARSRRIAGAVWVGLVVLLTAWELAAFFSLPRQAHPTLSSIADDIMRTHPGRALMVALWLALGWLLFARTPRTARTPWTSA